MSAVRAIQYLRKLSKIAAVIKACEEHAENHPMTASTVQIVVDLAEILDNLVHVAGPGSSWPVLLPTQRDIEQFQSEGLTEAEAKKKATRAAVLRGVETSFVNAATAAGMGG